MTLQKSWQPGKESKPHLTTLGDLRKKELRQLPPHHPPPLPPPPPPLPLAVTRTVVGDSTLGVGQRTVGGGRQGRGHILVGRRTLNIKFKFQKKLSQKSFIFWLEYTPSHMSYRLAAVFPHLGNHNDDDDDDDDDIDVDDDNDDFPTWGTTCLP